MENMPALNKVNQDRYLELEVYLVNHQNKDINLALKLYEINHEGWLCPGCESEDECIDILNESQGKNLPITENWEVNDKSSSLC